MTKTTKQHDFFISIPDFLKLIRAKNLLIVALTQYLARIFLIGPKEEWVAHLMDTRFMLLCFSTLLIAASGYIINDYYDVKIDTINKPNEVVIGRIMRRRVAMFTHTTFNFIGIAIGFYLSKTIGIINFFAAFWLWLYSNQLKREPFIGNISVAALTALSVLILSIYFETQNYLIYIYGVFAFFISVIREIIKDMEDVRGDLEFGCKTLPIVWGFRKTKSLVFFLLGAFTTITIILLTYIESAWLHGYFAVMILPLGWFSVLLYRADTKRKFSFLSNFCKWVMVSGVLAMTLI
ncbi:geranylgeranylglycerol-phosphate geranylgeranyltransferase [Limibacter armeniacum]|uniref:geranylgeranylglycerol-phosphate geranylgeranyltransferase n=1 Tax=Limibacter armeniacum TaxID=466084 RepID=UPI002FE6B7F3